MRISVSVTPGVTAGARSNLRMGAKVPVMMITSANVPKDVPQVGPISYQDVGTNIDAFVQALEDSRFRVEVTIDDSTAIGWLVGG